MKKGSHLVSKRTLYTHHGIYIGDDDVIHYSGFSDGLNNEGEVEIVSLDIFSAGNSYTIRKHPNRKYNSKESIERANSRLGESDYSVFNNNCEHFVNWCIEGKRKSDQVNYVVNTARNTAVTYGAKHYLKKKVPEVATSAFIKSTASTATGSVAGIAAASATTGATATTVVSAIAAGSLASAALPIAVTVGVGVSVAYGVKKAFDWFSD